MTRIVALFSCGVPSAVATKLALAKYGDRVVIVRNVIASEHPDNDRFARDCAAWFGQSIVEICSDQYTDHWQVMEARKYISSLAGAPCTLELKQIPRLQFQEPGDLFILGYTADPKDAARAARGRARPNPLNMETPLIDNGLMRSDCLAIIDRAGIQIPAMYFLKFENNNCIGCAKATSPTYWNRTRRHFPEAFDRMAVLQRKLDYSQIRVNGEPVFLDELDPLAGRDDKEPDIECSLFCHLAEDEITDAEMRK